MHPTSNNYLSVNCQNRDLSIDRELTHEPNAIKKIDRLSLKRTWDHSGLPETTLSVKKHRFLTDSQDEIHCTESNETDNSEFNSSPQKEMYISKDKTNNSQTYEYQQCKFCHKRESTIMALPCKDIICCEDCAREVYQCPVCSYHVQGTVITVKSDT